MPISRVKSSLPEFGILAVRKRELIIEEVHIPGFSLDVILNLKTARSGMTSVQGMHLYFTICPVRDEISEDESSLEEDFYPQG